MKKALLLASAVALTAGAADAGSRFGRPNGQQYWKQQQILAEEFRRARAVGGYNDPLTALSNVLSGNATEKDVTSGVNSIFDTPGFGTIRLKGRWD